MDDIPAFVKSRVPSLDDWEKGWNEKLKAETLPSGVAAHATGQGMPKLVAVDFRAALAAVAQAN